MMKSLLAMPTLNESRVTPVFYVSLNMESGSIKLSCISHALTADPKIL